MGDAGILAQAKPGALLIDCSTIAPEVAREVAAAAAEKGLRRIDAPVSGGTAGAGGLDFSGIYQLDTPAAIVSPTAGFNRTP